jgi:hypothetical protein
MEREPSTWGYIWTTLSLGDIKTETWSSRQGVGRKADILALKKNNIVAISKEVKTGRQTQQNLLRRAMA